jgi:hypothetical protein
MGDKTKSKLCKDIVQKKILTYMLTSHTDRTLVSYVLLWQRLQTISWKLGQFIMTDIANDSKRSNLGD